MGYKDRMASTIMLGESEVVSGATLTVSGTLAGTTVDQAETFAYDLAAASGAGGVAKVQNPLGVAAIVEYLALDVTTAATGAATVDAGVDSDGTSSDDTLIDGLDVNAATGLFTSANDGGTNGASYRRIGATEYIVVSQASGDVTGLAGHVVFRLQPIANN